MTWLQLSHNPWQPGEKKQITQHQKEKCADCDEMARWRNLFPTNCEIQIEEMTPSSKLKPCARETPISLPDWNISWEGGRARGGGEGGVMSRWVKITWQARGWPHTSSCQKSGEFCFWVIEGSPGRSFSKHRSGEKPGMHCHMSTHTRTRTLRDLVIPNLNSLDGRQHCLNNPRFLPGLGLVQQSTTPAGCVHNKCTAAAHRNLNCIYVQNHTFPLFEPGLSGRRSNGRISN